MSGQIEARLNKLGIVLPPSGAPVGNYVATMIAGDLLYVSGQLPRREDGSLMTGTLGGGCGLADGQAAARACGLSILVQAKAELGDLERIRQVVKLTGFVACTADFTEHPQVVNGASDLMVEVLGDRGRHTRAAVGVASLPGGAAVEVEAIIAIGA